MRIEHDDKSFIEMTLSHNPGKVFITLGARDPNNILKLNISTDEITLKQLGEMIKDLNVEIPK